MKYLIKGGGIALQRADSIEEAESAVEFWATRGFPFATIEEAS